MPTLDTLRRLLDHHDDALRQQGLELLRALPVEQAKAAVCGLKRFRDRQLSGVALSGIDLSQRALAQVSFDGCRLDGANLFGTDLTGSSLVDADLSRADLTGATLIDTDLEGAILTGACLRGAQIEGSRLVRADLTGADLTDTVLAGLSLAALSGAVLEGAFLRRCDLIDANLKEANLSGADLKTCDLTGALLTGANLSSACLAGVSLRNADLKGADLTGADLRWADLRGTDLSGAVLTGADLTGSLQDGLPGPLPFLDQRDLSGADLSGRDLSGASLARTRLAGADFEGANLSRAWLAGADLSRANLSGANLTGACLERANLRGADLTGAALSRVRSDGALCDTNTRLDVPLIGAWLLTPGADLSDRYFIDADLSGANLSGANLSGATLFRVDLRNANLTGATLTGTLAQCDLRGADLTGAMVRKKDNRPWLTDANWNQLDLRGASLRGITLPRGTSGVYDWTTRQDVTIDQDNPIRLIGPGADLRFAVLTGIDLTGTDLSCADLTGADLTGARFDATTRWPGTPPPPTKQHRPCHVHAPTAPDEDPIWLSDARSVPLWDGAWVLVREDGQLRRRRYRVPSWPGVIRPSAMTVSGPVVVDLDEPGTRQEALVRLMLEMGAKAADVILAFYSGEHWRSEQTEWCIRTGTHARWSISIEASTEAEAVAALWRQHRTRLEAGEASDGVESIMMYNPPFRFGSPSLQSAETREEIRNLMAEQEADLPGEAARWWIVQRLTGKLVGLQS